MTPTTREKYFEDQYDALIAKVADLRDVFPWPDEYDIDKGCDPSHPKAWHLAEIVHSAEYCLDAMICQFAETDNDEDNK